MLLGLAGHADRDGERLVGGHQAPTVVVDPHPSPAPAPRSVVRDLPTDVLPVVAEHLVDGAVRLDHAPVDTARSHTARTAPRLWETKTMVVPRPPGVLELLEAPLLEGGVADGEHLVDEEHMGAEEGGHGEAKPDAHATGVEADGAVHGMAELAELDDLVEALLDAGGLDAEEGAGQADVLAAGQLGVEAGLDLDQRADIAADAHGAGVGVHHAGEQLEEGGLPGAVGADEPDRLAGRDGEIDVAERPSPPVWWKRLCSAGAGSSAAGHRRGSASTPPGRRPPPVQAHIGDAHLGPLEQHRTDDEPREGAERAGARGPRAGPSRRPRRPDSSRSRRRAG